MVQMRTLTLETRGEMLFDGGGEAAYLEHLEIQPTHCD